MLSFGTAEQLASGDALASLCKQIEIAPYPSRSLFQRLVSTLTSPSPDMALRLESPEMQVLATNLQSQSIFDIVQVEGIEMARYLKGKRSGNSSVVFDDHNAEYVLQKTALQADARNPIRWHAALYSLVQTLKLERYECRVCRGADCVIAASSTDARSLGALDPTLNISVIPNGVDTDYYSPPPPGRGGSASAMVFTGKMDFRPNVDAMTWFCSEILPRIRAALPSARLVVVGQKPSPRVLALQRPGAVEVTGGVPDTRPYIADSAVYVVPLRMGSGTRLKVLEAMAMGKPIVSTPRGVEGIDCVPGRDLIVAETEDEFAAAVVALLQDPVRQMNLGHSARRLAESKYDWRQIVPAFDTLYADLLQLKSKRL